MRAFSDNLAFCRDGLSVFTKLNLMFLTSVNNINRGTNIFYLSTKTSLEDVRFKTCFHFWLNQLSCYTLSYQNSFMYLYQFDWTGEFYDCIHQPISALWTFPRVPAHLFYGNHKTDNWTYNFLHSWTRNYWNNGCIMNEVRATLIFGVCKIIFFHQLTNKIISRKFSRRASVDKCIKCSRKFCNIFWKTWAPSC